MAAHSSTRFWSLLLLLSVALPTINACSRAGATCDEGDDCCSGNCFDGVCGCQGRGGLLGFGSCVNNSDCCSGSCAVNGCSCTAIAGGEFQNNLGCYTNADCCNPGAGCYGDTEHGKGQCRFTNPGNACTSNDNCENSAGTGIAFCCDALCSWSCCSTGAVCTTNADCCSNSCLIAVCT